MGAGGSQDLLGLSPEMVGGGGVPHAARMVFNMQVPVV